MGGMKCIRLLAPLCLLVGCSDLHVSTDFEGGSALVESIDQETATIRIRPGGDPDRGWPCWWYLRIQGAGGDGIVTIDLLPSTGKLRVGVRRNTALASSWSMPDQAAISHDNANWIRTEPGKRAKDQITYRIKTEGGAAWVAWGPPFTPRHTDEWIARLKGPTICDYQLAVSRGGRPVRGLHFQATGGRAQRVVWVQARQHAWESGGSWVASGLARWLASEDEQARSLRKSTEIFLTPIMDVDNVATGNGGKEQIPHDHNRDWTVDPPPHFPEVAAAQQRLKAFDAEGRLALFIDLHNPGAGDKKPFFFVPDDTLLSDTARRNQNRFLLIASRAINGPLPLADKPKPTGPRYDPLWRQISGCWAAVNLSPAVVNVCLETAWNLPACTTEGYQTVGGQLGRAIEEYLREEPRRERP